MIRYVRWILRFHFLHVLGLQALSRQSTKTTFQTDVNLPLDQRFRYLEFIASD